MAAAIEHDLKKRAQLAGMLPEPVLLIAGDAGARVTRESIPIFDPVTGLEQGHCPCATESDLEAAILGARSAFERWKERDRSARATMLDETAQILRNRSEMLADIVTFELGKPRREALADVSVAADIFAWCAGEARRDVGQPLAAGAAEGSQYTRLEPIGPVAAFSSWNAPLITPARKIASALAAGCPVILKAAEEAPRSAVAVAKAVYDAGAPPGVLSLLFGNPVKISSHLLDSPRIRGFTFTGSTTVGRELSARAARTFKRQVLELGGHAPVIIFGDVDIEAVARQAAAAKFRNAGQICTSPTRFLIEAAAHDRFLELFAAATRKLAIGDGFDPEVDMGPLATAHRRSAIAALVDDAVSEGMSVVAGGSALDCDGYFFEPTILSGPVGRARAWREEPFGPVALVAPFESEAEALEIANGLPVGLAAYVMTSSDDRGRRVAASLEAGTVAVNGWRASLPGTPFGGVKDSGLGREGGEDGVRAFQDIKCISIN